MKLVNKALLERWDSFINSCTADDKILLFHDRDTDGITSAVILSKLIEHKRGRQFDSYFFPGIEDHTLSSDLFEKIKSIKPNKIIFTDLSADDNPVLVKKLEQFAEIVIIDHHKLNNNVTSEKTILLKPQLLCEPGTDASQYCSAKLALDLSARLMPVNELEWIAAVGTILDITTKSWLPFLEHVYKKLGIPFPKNDDFFHSQLGDVGSVMDAAICYDVKNTPLCFEVLSKAKLPADVINSQLKKFQKEVEDEINSFIARFESDAEYFPELELYVYKINPRFKIKSSITTILGLKYPSKTVIVISEEDGFVKVSARRGDGAVPVNTLMQEGVQGFSQASGGGHVKASGAFMLKKDFPVFRERVLSILRKSLNTVSN